MDVNPPDSKLIIYEGSAQSAPGRIGSRIHYVTQGAPVTELLPMSTKHCTVERDGHVVILTMNRPESKNALSPDMLVGLAQGFDYVDETDDVRVAILTGAGGCFSSGADLKAMSKPSEDPRVVKAMADAPNLHWKALLRDHRLTKPLIAAVEGYAVAGGTEMLQGTDIRIAGEGAIFGVWEAKRGLFPLGGSACGFWHETRDDFIKK